MALAINWQDYLRFSFQCTRDRAVLCKLDYIFLVLCIIELRTGYCCWLCGQESEPFDEDEPAAVPVPSSHRDDRKHMQIGDQTNKETVQNFLTGDFCVHGVSLISSWNLFAHLWAHDPMSYMYTLCLVCFLLCMTWNFQMLAVFTAGLTSCGFVLEQIRSFFRAVVVSCIKPWLVWFC